MIIRIKQFSKADEYYIVYYESGKIIVYYNKLPKTAQEFMETHKSSTFIYGTKVNPCKIKIWE